MAKPKRVDVCCNPFSKPQNMKKNLREINSNLVKKAKQVSIKLKKGDFICGGCRTQIIRAISESQTRESDENATGKETQVGITRVKYEKVCCNPFAIHGDDKKKEVRSTYYSSKTR